MNQITRRTLILLLTLGVLALAWAGATAGSSEKVRLFTVEKSKNPQNILVVYCVVNEQCEFERIPDAGHDHLFDMHWLMDGTTYKRTHPIIKKMARKRFVAQNAADHCKCFDVRLADLKELVHDLPSDIIHVGTFRDGSGRCRARARIQLGPSGGYRALQIESIYSKARTLMGIPIGIHYIELRGIDVENSRPLSIRFDRNKSLEFDDPAVPNHTSHH